MRLKMLVAFLLCQSCAKDSFVPLKIKTDEFKQNVAAKMDILWVVDNSESMSGEQAALGQSFRVFARQLTESRVDYHIGVVSTDVADFGKLHRVGDRPFVIDAALQNAEDIFLQNVKVGVQGSKQEKGLATAALALGVGGSFKPGDRLNIPVENQGFLRDDASLFMIVVSDEDDSSFGPVDYYWRLFESYKGIGNESRVSFSAIVGDVANGLGCKGSMGNAQPGYRYVELASMTGGVFASICGDFNESLSELSLNAAGLKSIFNLSSYPNLDAQLPCGDAREFTSICVLVDGVAVPMGDAHQGFMYVPEKNAIVFGRTNIPKAQANITVQYEEL